MSAMDQIRAKAKANQKHIVLAEGSEDRTVQAAALIVGQGLAKVTLVGPEADVKAKAAEHGVNLTGVTIADPATDARTEGYAAKLYELRKAKGVTQEQAQALTERISEINPDCDVEVVDGGQPLYYYLVSVE